jgi:ribonucleoside-diphosphate reductase alpha chain
MPEIIKPNQAQILEILNKYNTNLWDGIDINQILKATESRLPENITYPELLELMAGISASLANSHPDYSILGARILMSKLYYELELPQTIFSESVKRIYEHTVHGRKSTRMSQNVFDFIQRNSDKLEEIIDYEKDFGDYDYSAVASFLKRGLEKVDNQVVEVPSQMFLRVAIGVNINQERQSIELEAFKNVMNYEPSFNYIRDADDSVRLERIREYYNLLVNRKLSLPGPILMHAGSETNQMASCFLEYCGDSLTDDNYHIDGKVGGIMKAITQLAAQSKGGAGSAISLTDIRSSSSPIMKTGGKSNGILPFMKMIDATIGAIDQSGKRAGVCTVYLEPWHADILEFLDAADHFTIEEKRCKHLFFGLWMNDLFFERMTRDKGSAQWTLFDPAIATKELGKPLSQYFGDEFKSKYEYLESLNVGKTISLMEVWSRVCKLFQTAGMPYIVNKDQMNLKSNQKNIGTIYSSNVCTEIALASNSNETAVCVLSSLCLGRFYNPLLKSGVDYEEIIQTARIATKNLNNVIDLQYYPTPETRNSCLARRAIGIGAQGLADLFAQLDYEYTSKEAQEVNKNVYECIYYGSLLESMELAKNDKAYLGFEGSELSKGILQFDMWKVNAENTFLGVSKWNQLKADIMKYGVRNSEVTAIAPTMSASIRMGQNEMHEPFGRNIYIRQIIAGSMQIVNQYLVKDLLKLNLWNDYIMAQIINNQGSVVGISSIPEHIQRKYQTVYEVDFKTRNQMMADRAPFISQTASYNQYCTNGEASPTAFSARIVDAWRRKLKTLVYYMHTEAATTAKKEFSGLLTTPDLTISNEAKVLADGSICVMEAGCEACSS